MSIGEEEGRKELKIVDTLPGTTSAQAFGSGTSICFMISVKLGSRCRGRTLFLRSNPKDFQTKTAAIYLLTDWPVGNLVWFFDCTVANSVCAHHNTRYPGQICWSLNSELRNELNWSFPSQCAVLFGRQFSRDDEAPEVCCPVCSTDGTLERFRLSHVFVAVIADLMSTEPLCGIDWVDCPTQGPLQLLVFQADGARLRGS